MPRILISRLSAHGDVIQTLPLLAAIKAHNPNFFVGWVVEESAAPLLENHPLIDRLHVFRRKRWFAALRNPLNWPGTLQDFRQYVRELRQEKYTIGFDVQGLFKSALQLFLAGIPRRVGYAAPREQADLFYTETLPTHEMKNPRLPTVIKFAEFAALVGCEAMPQFKDQPESPDNWSHVAFPIPPISEAAQAKVKNMLRGLSAHHHSHSPLIALAPATIWPTKHWIEAGWKTLLQHLTEQGYSCLLLGAPTDAALIERLLQGVPNQDQILNLAGKTSWTDLYAVFTQVDILVGLDSAPLHIANAVGHPAIIGLYGPTGPKRTGPVGNHHITLHTNLSCQPCFKRICPIQTHDCMKELSSEVVIAAVEAQIQRLFPQAVPSV